VNGIKWTLGGKGMGERHQYERLQSSPQSVCKINENNIAYLTVYPRPTLSWIHVHDDAIPPLPHATHTVLYVYICQIPRIHSSIQTLGLTWLLYCMWSDCWVCSVCAHSDWWCLCTSCLCRTWSLTPSSMSNCLMSTASWPRYEGTAEYFVTMDSPCTYCSNWDFDCIVFGSTMIGFTKPLCYPLLNLVASFPGSPT